jgi:hypothetical protein
MIIDNNFDTSSTNSDAWTNTGEGSYSQAIVNNQIVTTWYSAFKDTTGTWLGGTGGRIWNLPANMPYFQNNTYQINMTIHESEFPANDDWTTIMKVYVGTGTTPRLVENKNLWTVGSPDTSKSYWSQGPNPNFATDFNDGILDFIIVNEAN